MAVYNVLPTGQITGDDIRDTINNFGGSANNNHLTFFDSVADINKWSKRKPVPLNVDFCQDFSSSQPNYLANWWKGSDGLCGFIQRSIVFTDAASLINAYNTKDATWKYQTPTPPYRNGDFRGYSKVAVSPCNAVTIDGELMHGDNNSSVRVSTVIYNLDYDTNLSISDLKLGTKEFKDCYYGVILVQGGTAHPYYYKTLSTPIGTVNSSTIRLSLDFTRADLEKIITAYGTYNIYPAIFTQAHTPTFTSTLKADTSMIAVPPPHTGTFQHSFELLRPIEEQEVLFSDAWWQGGDRLRMGGTIMYKAGSWQSKTVNVSYYKNGVNIDDFSHNITLDSDGAIDSNGFRYKDFSHDFINGASQNDYGYTIKVIAGSVSYQEATARERFDL